MKLYNFTLNDFARFKDKSGIYAIVHNNEIIYVGQSSKINERLRTHNSPGYIETITKKIIKEGGKCNRSKSLAMAYFIKEHREELYFTVLKETTELNKWEEYYITSFKPRFNYKGVDVPYKENKNENTNYNSL